MNLTWLLLILAVALIALGALRFDVLVAPGARVMAKLGSIGCAELQCV